MGAPAQSQLYKKNLRLTTGAPERLRVVPAVLMGAVPHGTALLLYLSFGADVHWLRMTQWWFEGGVRLALALGLPVCFSLGIRFSRRFRQAFYGQDWFLGGLAALGMAWVTGGLYEMVDHQALGLLGRWLLGYSWAIWKVVGLALIMVGAIRLAAQLTSEQQARHRLEALMEFTRQVTNLDYQATMDQTVRYLHWLLKSDACVLFLWDEKERVLAAVSGVHDPVIYAEAYVKRSMAFRFPKGHGLTGWVAETGEPLIVGDVMHDPRTQRAQGGEVYEKSSLLAPLQVEGRLIGVVRLTRGGLNQFNQEDLDLALSFSGQAALVIQHVRTLKELSELSTTDSLTGLHNARHFHHVLASEINRAERQGTPLALIMVDSDSLKRMNDQLGHQTGDDYLRGIAQVLLENVRLSDYAFRYAGDEFMLVLPNTDGESALLVGERIRWAIQEKQAKPGIAGTVSVGVAVLPHHAHDPESLLAAADRAMYASKQQGKNRVTLAPLPHA